MATGPLLLQAVSHACAVRLELPKIFPCAQCSKVLDSETKLKNHTCLEASQDEVIDISSDEENGFKKTENPVTIPLMSKSKPTVIQLTKTKTGSSEEVAVNPTGDADGFCSICNSTVLNPKYLLLHQKMFHRKGNAQNAYKCHVCGTNSSSKQGYISHQFTTHLKDDIPKAARICPICKSDFYSWPRLASHYSNVHLMKTVSAIPKTRKRKHNKNHRIQCDFCRQKFIDHKLLKCHKFVKHNVKCSPSIFKRCNFCGKKCDSAKDFLSHVKRSHVKNSSNGLKKNVVSKTTEENTACTKTSDLQDIDPSKSKEPKKEGRMKIKRRKCLQCRICNYKAKYPSNFRHHLKIAHCKVCEVCKKPFISSAILDCHMQVEHSANRNSNSYAQCDLCETKCASAKEVLSHIEKDHEPSKMLSSRVVWCPSKPSALNGDKCDGRQFKARLKKAKESQIHNSDDISGEMYKCFICKVVTRSNKTLKNHMKKHAKSCSICGQQFMSLRTLKCHKMVVHEEKCDAHNYKVCNFCGETCGTPQKFLTHNELVHTLVNNHSAENSKESGDIKISDKEGQKEENTVQSDIAKSTDIAHKDKCDKSEIDQPKAKRLFKCNLCVQNQVSLHALKCHKLVKHKQRCLPKYYKRCDMCDKQFSTPWSCLRHITQQHSDATVKKPLNHLKHDALVHKNKNDFYCDVCDRSFFDKAVLKRHIVVVHEKKGKYPCRKCDMNCLDRKDYFEHQQKCLGTLLKCDKCEMTSTSSKLLKEHCANVHNMKYEPSDKIGVYFDISYRFDCLECAYSAFESGDLINHHLLSHSDSDLKIWI